MESGFFPGLMAGILAMGVVLAVVLAAERKKHHREVSRVQVLEEELSRNQMAMMISQIRPHFIFNTLNAIGAMCLTEPEKADEAITWFSDYLRANIMILEDTQMIPFQKELEHVQNYVRIEQMRFGDKIQVEYDISYTQFEVPLLSLQPIVENAIKHGISKRMKGGTVQVNVIEEESGIRISVEDDGVGFQMSKMGETSVGLKNIESRWKLFCEAEVKVQSEPGKGTSVTIEIPKGRKFYENTVCG